MITERDHSALWSYDSLFMSSTMSLPPQPNLPNEIHTGPSVKTPGSSCSCEKHYANLMVLGWGFIFHNLLRTFSRNVESFLSICLCKNKRLNQHTDFVKTYNFTQSAYQILIYVFLPLTVPLYLIIISILNRLILWQRECQARGKFFNNNPSGLNMVTLSTQNTCHKSIFL